MLFNVVGLTVEVNQYFNTNINVGCYCAHMYVQHTILRGEGEDSSLGPVNRSLSRLLKDLEKK